MSTNRKVMMRFFNECSLLCKSKPFTMEEVRHKTAMMQLVDELDSDTMTQLDVYVKAVDLINLACPDEPIL